MNDKEKLLEQLTGVDSSKLNYYVELKKRTEEVLKQNSRLEILHQLTHDINIDMSIQDILERAFTKLPQALPCDFLGLATIRGEQLVLKAMMPRDFCQVDRFPHHAPSWQVIRAQKAGVFDPQPSYRSHLRHNPAYPEQLREIAIAPMFERSDVIGALLVGSVMKPAYSEAELSFVQHLADQLAISIQNARLYKQVSRAKKEWEETFKAVTDPIILIDTDYNVLLHNDRLPPELMEIWSRGLTDKCHDRLHGLKRPCRDCPVEEVKRTLQPASLRTQTDSGLLFDLTYYPVLNEESQLVAITVFMKDVTQKTKLEAQLVHSAKLAALGEMAAGVAHELNSPMTVIIGTAQMLVREIQGGKGLGNIEELEDIFNCGVRCKRIIQNLLTFSRQDQAPVTDTDLNAEARRVLSLIKYQINRSQIRILEHLDPDLPKLAANGPQIQQVLTNFLVNARDALNSQERDDKVIEVSTTQRVQENKRWVVLSVRDNGCGIAQENLSKIFTPFYTSKEATKGTGLGLSVCLGIAESHNGRIEVESKLGQGSTFSLVLPLENP
ncbi:GAF domain-containing sensor histidine kinase [Desulfuromonas versatilis]|uniref:GAF domain-containing sensor histidine kinase n=1 Tax=Desulfuromonas versatilis TaxID=2802975 RepID=UPI001C844682